MRSLLAKRQELYLGIALVFGIASCGTPSDRRAAHDIQWEDLEQGRHMRPNAPIVTAESNQTISQEDRFERWAKMFRLERPQAYEGGVYGKVGTATVFIAPRDKVPDYDRLYWVMVKVLSEKYGCFIKRKESNALSVNITCRDSRQIVLRRNRGEDWIQFYGRQYDKLGNEIVITPRRTASR